MFLISYYTPNYQQQAQNLINSLLQHDIPNEVRQIEDLGGWDLNTKFKPHFILEHLNNHPYVVWTDADSVVKSYPSLFDTFDCDIAFHRFKGQELLSGTVYFANTEKSKEVLNLWIKLNEQHPELWDQRTLELAINKTRGLRLSKLPPEYCCIYDLTRRAYKKIEPVIEHYQASRELK